MATDRARAAALYLMTAALGLVIYQQLLIRTGFRLIAQGWCVAALVLALVLVLLRPPLTA